MIFHENRLLLNDSHEIYLIFFSSAAVVIGALRENKKKMNGHVDLMFLFKRKKPLDPESLT